MVEILIENASILIRPSIFDPIHMGPDYDRHFACRNPKKTCTMIITSSTYFIFKMSLAVNYLEYVSGDRWIRRTNGQ